MRILRNKLGIELPIRTELNFPVKGMEFIDIVPLTLNKDIFDMIIQSFVQKIKDKNLEVDYIIGPESRGFLFGTAVAKELDVGFIPVRKKRKIATYNNCKRIFIPKRVWIGQAMFTKISG